MLLTAHTHHIRDDDDNDGFREIMEGLAIGLVMTNEWDANHSSGTNNRRGTIYLNAIVFYILVANDECCRLQY